MLYYVVLAALLGLARAQPDPTMCAMRMDMLTGDTGDLAAAAWTGGQAIHDCTYINHTACKYSVALMNAHLLTHSQQDMDMARKECGPSSNACQTQLRILDRVFSNVLNDGNQTTPICLTHSTHADRVHCVTALANAVVAMLNVQTSVRIAPRPPPLLAAPPLPPRRRALHPSHPIGTADRSAHSPSCLCSPGSYGHFRTRECARAAPARGKSRPAARAAAT